LGLERKAHKSKTKKYYNRQSRSGTQHNSLAPMLCVGTDNPFCLPTQEHWHQIKQAKNSPQVFGRARALNPDIVEATGRPADFSLRSK